MPRGTDSFDRYLDRVENLSYQDAYAFAYGYLSAEVKDAIRKLGDEPLAARFSEVLEYLEKTIETAKGK